MQNNLIIDADSDIRYALRDADLAKTAHIFDQHWHGIRAACSALPGMKIGINHTVHYSAEELNTLLTALHERGIEHIIYQGFSDTAEQLVKCIASGMGRAVKQYAVTHVSPSQFEHHFEMYMIARMMRLKRHGHLARIVSVKPGFANVHEDIDDHLLINAPPSLPVTNDVLRCPNDIFIPLENTWRKNLYTNMISSIGLPQVTTVFTVNEPTYLDVIHDLSKVRLSGFLDKQALYGLMSAVGVVMNVTLIECQPMTQLEALAVGTPCLTGPLNIPQFAGSAYAQLTEVDQPDNISAIREKLGRIIGMWHDDPGELTGILTEHSTIRARVAIETYKALIS